MLRVAIVLLLLANLAFFVWTQGWLDAVVGVRAIGDREPERLLRQVRPETVRILPAANAASAPSPAGAPATTPASAAVSTLAAPAESLACLESGPFTDAEIGTAQAAAQVAVPGAGWVEVQTTAPGAWLVYMGRYPNVQALNSKADELKRRRVAFEVVRTRPGLEPGLSLGRFDDLTRATRALDGFAQQGIRTARVVELAVATRSHRLRHERVDAALAARLAAGGEGLLGKALLPCGPKPQGA